MQRFALLLFLTLTFGGGSLQAGVPKNDRPDDPIAPLLEGMGPLHFEISTGVARAQRYFNQGLTLAYAFNHAESARSFREAARLDAECAMCHWGEALALGPNINAGMDPENIPTAYAAVRRALALADGASEREQALIHALATRYAAPDVADPDDRSALDKAYTAAMLDLARRFPDDADVLTLYAESLMDTMPWDYWAEDGTPKAGTREVLAALEAAMAMNPDHPGANHLYIHAVEAVHPEQGIAAAERLEQLVPGAGHLVHMPSHIYIRVGRYHDASLANERSIVADREYVTQCHAQGLYPLAYMPHNYHFLWAAATLEGRSETALAAAHMMEMHTDTLTMREDGYGTLQHYWITPLYALIRFGRWDDVLAYPTPAADLPYPNAILHYARGLAYVRAGRLDDARQALQSLTAISAEPAIAPLTVWDINTVTDLLAVARNMLAGELAAAEGRYPEAIALLEEAVRLEDALNYDEPPTWHAPVRQTLGAVLLDADRAADAERVYRDDLARFPENGWSLFGLMTSLEAQGHTIQALAARRRFERAWSYADVTLEASRY